MDVSSKVEVVWADNSKTIILPQVRPCQAQTAQLRWRGWEPDLSSPLGGQPSPSWGGAFLWVAEFQGKLERVAGIAHPALWSPPPGSLQVRVVVTGLPDGPGPSHC